MGRFNLPSQQKIATAAVSARWLATIFRPPSPPPVLACCFVTAVAGQGRAVIACRAYGRWHGRMVHLQQAGCPGPRRSGSARDNAQEFASDDDLAASRLATTQAEHRRSDRQAVSRHGPMMKRIFSVAGPVDRLANFEAPRRTAGQACEIIVVAHC